MDLAHYLQIALLAVIQGAAELLPVSSSAHVIVAERVMGMDPSRPEQVFLLVMLHTGTMFAVLVYFWPRWRRLWMPQAERPSPGQFLPAGQFLAERQSRPWRQFVEGVMVATAVTGVVGMGLKYLIEKEILIKVLKHPEGDVEELFKYLPLIAAGLAAVGVMILAAGARESASNAAATKGRGTAENASASATTSAGYVSRWAAVWIGLVQGFCLPFRGFSRSGATISTGLFCGVPRSLAEDFSFALALVLTPPVQLYSIYKLHKKHELSSHTLLDALTPGLVGMVLSFAAGLVALRLLSAVLERGRWKFFGYYCLVAAIVVFAADFLLPPV